MEDNQSLQKFIYDRKDQYLVFLDGINTGYNKRYDSYINIMPTYSYKQNVKECIELIKDCNFRIRTIFNNFEKYRDNFMEHINDLISYINLIQEEIQYYITEIQTNLDIIYNSKDYTRKNLEMTYNSNDHTKNCYINYISYFENALKMLKDIKFYK